MLVLYFSGTGNTKYACEEFASHFPDALVMNVEQETWKTEIQHHQMIVFGHPIQFSNCPVFVRDLIHQHHQLFTQKKVFIIATMGLFSGDGAGCSARIFKKYKVKVLGGLHVKMPDNIADSKLLKKSIEVQKETLTKANIKIEKAANKLKKNQPMKNGLTVWHHIAGLFGQRLWFKKETKHYMDDVSISSDCTKCKVCTTNCPTSNLTFTDGIMQASSKCTRCYRCVNQCPAKAITILGDSIVRQYKLKDIISE